MAALDWSQSKISRLESGQTPYDQYDLELAAEVFGCTPEDLITRAPDRPGPAVSGEEAVRLLLSRIEGLSDKNVEALIGVMQGFAGFNIAQQKQNPGRDQSAPSTPRHEEAPSRQR